jgi:F0F1-type ATP synthase beta subunit
VTLVRRLDQGMDTKAAAGIVVSVRGAVVDVSFDGERLPLLNTALVVMWDRLELARRAATLAAKTA